VSRKSKDFLNTNLRGIKAAPKKEKHDEVHGVAKTAIEGTAHQLSQGNFVVLFF
jgi:hypothetical protein